MDPFPFLSDQYIVGNDLLDRQHKKMLEIADRAAEILAASPFCSADFQALVSDYLLTQQQHFDDEEQALASNGYPDLSEHMAEHAAFSGAFGDILCQAWHGGVDAKAVMALIERYTHIHLQTDMACRDYLKAR